MVAGDHNDTFTDPVLGFLRRPVHACALAATQPAAGPPTARRLKSPSEDAGESAGRTGVPE